MMQKQRQTLIYIEEVNLMKKIYSMPIINVAYFEVENIVTLSGNTEAMTAAERIKEKAGETSVEVILQWKS